MCAHTQGMSASSIHEESVHSLISYNCVILFKNLVTMFSLAVRCKTDIMVSKGSFHSALGGNKTISST